MTPPGPAGQQAGNSSISGYNLRQLPNYTPQQMELFQSLLGGVQPGTQQGLGFLSDLSQGKGNAFAQMEEPAYRAFDKNIGNISNRFAGLGALGSSGFQAAASGAGRELAENLGVQRNQIQMGALDRLLGLSGNLLNQRPFENVLTQKPEKTSSIWGKILGGALPGLISSFVPGGGALNALSGLFGGGAGGPGSGGAGGFSGTPEQFSKIMQWNGR